MALIAKAVDLAERCDFPLHGRKGGITKKELEAARNDPREALALMTAWTAGKNYDAIAAHVIMSIFPELKWSADTFGNIWTEIAGENSKEICFMAHMDTVQTGALQYTQRFYQAEDYKKEERDFLRLDPDAKNHKQVDCLGADDRTGCAILISMMGKGVPGKYAFFHGEEGGRIGSTHFARNQEAWMKGVKKAIQFDRRGYDSVIARQSGTECASDAFVLALAKSLNDLMPEGMKDFRKDLGGSFTDTYSFTEMVPECTNISCGYFSPHSSSERQDVDFYLALTDAAIKLDWGALPAKRVPVPRTSYRTNYSNTGYNNGYGKKKVGEDDDEARKALDECMKQIFIDAMATRAGRSRVADLLLDAGVLYYVNHQLQD